METVPYLRILLAILFTSYLAGCAGPTRPNIPTQLPSLGNDMARVVFTREKQVAGVGSPFIVIDIGEQIEPNAMIHLMTGPFRSSETIAGGLFRTITAEILANQELSRQVQVLGSTEVGETLIWNRKPDVMRLGSVWYDGDGLHAAPNHS